MVLRAIFIVILLFFSFFCAPASASTLPTTISWSGYDWDTEYFNEPQTTDNVLIDSSGMHFFSKNIGGEWSIAGIECAQPLGYGVYTWDIAASSFGIDQSMISFVGLQGNGTAALACALPESDSEAYFYCSGASDEETFSDYIDTQLGADYQLKIIYSPNNVQFYLNRSDAVVGSFEVTDTTYIPTGTLTPFVEFFPLFEPPGTQEIIIRSFRYESYAPVSTFSQYGTKLLDVQFEGSTGNATSWYWDFGDGTNSTEQNPEHSYSAEGQYTVTLISSGEYGSNTTTQTVDVMLHAPRNYGGYVKKVFRPNMTSWDFVGGISSVYRDSVGDGLFFLILWAIPYISLWNRQGSTVIISILYLFTGAFVATVLPVYWGGALLWMMVLGTAGIIYRIFIPEN